MCLFEFHLTLRGWFCIYMSFGVSLMHILHFYDTSSRSSNTIFAKYFLLLLQVLLEVTFTFYLSNFLESVLFLE